MHTAADRDYALIPGYEHYYKDHLVQCFERLLESLSATCKDKTLAIRRQQMATAFLYFKGKHIKDITLQDIEGYIKYLTKERGNSGDEIRMKLSTLHRVFERAMDDGLIERNPLVWRKLPRLPKNKVVKVPFTWEEHCKLLAEIDNREKYKEWWPDVCRIAWHTGLRKGDVAHLEKKLVDLNAGIIRVRSQKKISTREELEIPIEDELRPIIERLMAEGDKSEWLCGWFRQYYIDWWLVSKVINAQFRQACDAVGLPRHSFHSYRHGFVTRLLNAQVDSIIIQQMTGQTLDVIRDYAHISLDAKKAALQRARPLNTQPVQTIEIP